MTTTARSAARARQSLDGADAQALEGALTMTERERDEWKRRAEYAERELSDALGLPATIGPVEGEAKRIVDMGRALRRDLQNLRSDMREPAERGDALLRHFYDRLDQVLRGVL